MFTGLLVNPSVFRKVGAKKYARAESPDFESDDESDPAMNDGDGATAEDSRPTKRQRSGEGIVVDDEESPLSDPHKLDEEVREEKISVFLSNPEKAVRIFLSSFMREHGLIWYVKFSVITWYDCLIIFLFLHRVKDGTQLDLYTSPCIFLPYFRSAEPCPPGTRIPARLETGPRND